VGKVEFLNLYPLSFFEFMMAMDKGQLAALLQKGDFEMAAAFKQDYADLLKHYYYVGGMPEAARSFAENRDFNEVREIQQRILDAYEQDFSKHTPNEAVPRIRMLWNSLPAQLAKENKKFIYGLIKEGARAKEYELALLWLADCGLVHQIHRVSAPRLPLKAYADMRAFKLFAVDVGLLSCMVGLRQDILLDGNALFREFKGALTEQYVLQQLKTRKNIHPFYWAAESGAAEVDFVIDTGNAVIPIEVKAEVNLQAKSLKSYREKFSPALSVRTSMADYKKDGWLLNLPLWAIELAGEPNLASGS
jgi:predicted AAA+ superfamily ATPase